MVEGKYVVMKVSKTRLITAGISILVATFFWIFVIVVAEDPNSDFYRYFDSYRYKYMNEETDIDNWN